MTYSSLSHAILSTPASNALIALDLPKPNFGRLFVTFILSRTPLDLAGTIDFAYIARGPKKWENRWRQTHYPSSLETPL